jgi:integrase
MPRPRKAPRLYLRPARDDRHAQWVIRDGEREESTGCGEGDLPGAERALALYLGQKYQPDPAQNKADLVVEQVLASWLIEHVPYSPSATWLMHMARPIAEWWQGKRITEINGPNCRAYEKWRTAQYCKGRIPPRLISDQTVRHELKALKNALKWYHVEHGPLPAVPAVIMPAAAEQKQDYWLTRKEVADRIRVARRSYATRHIARVLLIGIYTGTRPGAVLGLSWMTSTTSGYFDLESKTLHRRGTKSTRHRNKRQPPARIHDRLLPHLRRWRAADERIGCTNVIHWRGGPVKEVYEAWAAVAKRAGAVRHDGPHIIRHTAATWQMQAGTDIYEAAAYLGMTPTTLWNVYGHHHPDFQANAASAVPRRAKLEHAPVTPRKPLEQAGTKRKLSNP